MEKWQDFYYLCGSSAAGLTGLMFIAVTFGSKLVHKDNMDQVNTFLGSISFHFIHVFFLCCMSAVPELDHRLTAIGIFASGLYRLLRIPKIYLIMHKTANKEADIESSDWVLTLLLPAVAYLILIGAAAAYVVENYYAPYILATALIMLLMIGMRGAWDMLIWIATKVD